MRPETSMATITGAVTADAMNEHGGRVAK